MATHGPNTSNINEPEKGMKTFKVAAEKAKPNIAPTYGTKNKNNAAVVGGGGNPYTEKSEGQPNMATREKTNWADIAKNSIGENDIPRGMQMKSENSKHILDQ